jgi:hypothetical protein
MKDFIRLLHYVSLIMFNVLHGLTTILYKHCSLKFEMPLGLRQQQRGTEFEM